MLAAIASGKHVVTANKALLAEHGAEVFARGRERAASTSTTRPRCAAACRSSACCARASRRDRVEALYGIVNGTSNYILSTMTETRRRVRRHPRARRRSSATPRPIRRSTSAAATRRTSSRSSSTLCFGTSVDVTAIPTDGIDVVEPIDFDVRREVRLRDQAARDRARSRRRRSRRASTRRWSRANWLLADVSGAKNAVYVQSYALGPSMYYGAGAGMMPTAMAVVSDIIEIGRNMFARARRRCAPPSAPRPAAPRPLLPLADIRTRYYLRFGVLDQPGVLGQLMTSSARTHVSIAQVVQDGASARRRARSAVVVLTHEAREGDVRARARRDRSPRRRRRRPRA